MGAAVPENGMVVYAELEVPADGFRIGQAFGRLPAVRIVLDRIVPDGESVVPYIWVSEADSSEVLRVTREEHAVEEITVLSEETEGSTLYRVVWNRQFRDTIVQFSEANVALLSGEGTSDRWVFAIRAAERQPFSAFVDDLRTDGTPVSIIRIHEVAHPSREHTGVLTDAQREALQVAYTGGYFDEPRDQHLEALANELGISRQAFSGRLKRGLQNLLSREFDE
jgi:predicted DNA binding protein